MTSQSHPQIDADSFDSNMPNTRLDYMYRDADNYKQHSHAVMAGALSLDGAVAIMNGFDADDGFVPSAVGLDDLQEMMPTAWDDQSDHPYHEITGISLTDRTPTTDMTADDFARRFAAADWDKEGERITSAHERGGEEDDEGLED